MRKFLLIIVLALVVYFSGCSWFQGADITGGKLTDQEVIEMAEKYSKYGQIDKYDACEFLEGHIAYGISEKNSTWNVRINPKVFKVDYSGSFTYMSRKHEWEVHDGFYWKNVKKIEAMKMFYNGKYWGFKVWILVDFEHFDKILHEWFLPYGDGFVYREDDDLYKVIYCLLLLTDNTNLKVDRLDKKKSQVKDFDAQMERWEKLEQLYNDGLIDEQTYKKKKKEIIDDL